MGIKDENRERQEMVEDPAININYPPSTAYEKKPDEAYWKQVAANSAVVKEMEQVQQGSEQERQHMEDIQQAAAQGAAETLERRDRETRRLEGLAAARAAKKAHGKGTEQTTPEE